MNSITITIKKATEEEIKNSTLQQKNFYETFYKLILSEGEETFSMIVTPNFPVSEIVKSIKRHYNSL